MIHEKMMGAALVCPMLVGAVLLTGGCGVKEEKLHESLAPVARQTEELQADQEAMRARLAASEEEMKLLRTELDALRAQGKGRRGTAVQPIAKAAIQPAATPRAVMPNGSPIPPPRVVSSAEAAREGAGASAAPATSPVAAPAISPVAPESAPPAPPAPPSLSSGTLPVTASGAPASVTPVPPPTSARPPVAQPVVQPVTQPEGQPVAQAPAQPSKASEKSAYQKALSTFERKNFAEAEALFDQFLQQWPTAKLAPNALYWKAECLYSRGKFADSVFAFKDVITRYPKHPKAADALLKSAMAYKRLGDMDNANLHISVLAEDFPKSAALKRARELGFGR